jgi:hypothetical protein
LSHWRSRPPRCGFCLEGAADGQSVTQPTTAAPSPIVSSASLVSPRSLTPTLPAPKPPKSIPAAAQPSVASASRLAPAPTPSVLSPTTGALPNLPPISDSPLTTGLALLGGVSSTSYTSGAFCKSLPTRYSSGRLVYDTSQIVQTLSAPTATPDFIINRLPWPVAFERDASDKYVQYTPVALDGRTWAWCGVDVPITATLLPHTVVQPGASIDLTKHMTSKRRRGFELSIKSTFPPLA